MTPARRRFVERAGAIIGTSTVTAAMLIMVIAVVEIMLGNYHAALQKLIAISIACAIGAVIAAIACATWAYWMIHPDDIEDDLR